VESCTDIARIALDEALLELTENYGPNLESWRWGDAPDWWEDRDDLPEWRRLRGEPD